MDLSLEDILNGILKNELNIFLLENEIAWITVMEMNHITYKDITGLYAAGTRLGVSIFPLHYTDHKEKHENGELSASRYACVKEIYYRWCAIKNLKPNPKEGWFKSKKFTAYLDEIGYRKANYVVMAMN